MPEKGCYKDKIVSIEELSKLSRTLKKKNKRTILCHGVFDLLHPGHIRHLEQAREMGDILMVTITKDAMVNKGPGRPVFNERLRAESLAALSCVDYVSLSDRPTAVEIIKKIAPGFYVKGSEYSRSEDDITGKIVEEEDAVRSVGGELRFTDDITFSSTSLLNSHFSVFPDEASIFLRDFRSSHNADDIIQKLKALKDMSVLIIGDAIIDAYCYCSGMGKPSKDNIVAARYLNEEKFAGGTLAVANHVAGFCDDVTLVSMTGPEKEYRELIKEKLKRNVKVKLFENPNMKTIVKKRFLDPAFLSKMFEICYLEDLMIDKGLEKEVIRSLRPDMKKYDLVIVSDFGHGFISPGIIDFLSDKAGFLAVNTQTNSANTGFNLITKYPRADYVCIDEPEIRIAMQDKFSDIEKLVSGLEEKIQTKTIAVTRGHKGSLFYDKKSGFYGTPVFSKEIVDRIGAGDACLSVTAPAVAAGMSPEEAGFLCNAVGALAVLIVGNRTPVDPVALYKFIVTLMR